MNENKLNPLLDAMSEIDDSIITNTKKTKKRPLMIVAAAAAAATLLLTGAAVVHEIRYKSGFYIGDEDGVELPYKVLENASIPPYEELVEMWESSTTYSTIDTGTICEVSLDVSPGEFAQTCNVPLLTSDSFTEEKWVKIATEDSDPDRADIAYALVRNNGGERLYIVAACVFSDEVQYSAGKINPQRQPYEKVTLKDGSEGALHSSEGDLNWCEATFVDNGIIYRIFVDTNIDNMKQILTDLGVL